MVGAAKVLLRYKHVGWSALHDRPQPYCSYLELARPLRCDLARPHGELAVRFPQNAKIISHIITETF